METKTSLMTIEAEEKESSERALVRRCLPVNASDKSLATLMSRCQKANLVGASLRQAVELADGYEVRLSSIVRYVEKGIALVDLERALEIHKDYQHATNMTVVLAHRLDKVVDFQKENQGLVIETLIEAFEELGGMHPLHRGMHVIDEAFHGDALAAYHLYIESPQRFQQVVHRHSYFHPTGMIDLRGGLDADPDEEYGE